MEDKIIKFDPSEVKFAVQKEQLEEIVALTKSITAENLEDKDNLKVVKEKRTFLRKTEIDIEKQGKAMRDYHNAFNKEVLAKEKNLLGIIVPERTRLESIEDEAKVLQETKRRTLALPTKMERLAKEKIEATEEQILSMGELDFSTFLNDKITERNTIETARIEAEKQKLEEEKNKLAREQEINDREETARTEERERIEKAEQARKDHEELQKIEEEKARVQKEKDDADKLAKETKYQQWLVENEYTPDEFKIEKNGNVVTLLKIIGTYTVE